MQGWENKFGTIKHALMYWFQHLKLTVTLVPAVCECLFFPPRKNTSMVWRGMQELWTCTTDVRQELSPYPETQSKSSPQDHLYRTGKSVWFNPWRPICNVALLVRSQHERSPNAWRFTTCGKSRSALTSLCSRIGSGRKSTAATLAWRKRSLLILLSWVPCAWCWD